MRRFSQVCQHLESVPFHRNKAAILVAYLKSASEDDTTWALYLLLGGQLPRVLDPASLQEWVLRASGLPTWLLEECREQAGDLSETIALLGQLAGSAAAKTPQGAEGNSNSEANPTSDPEAGLRDWIEHRLLPLAKMTDHQKHEVVLRWWSTQSIDISWAAQALAIGKFPVHLPRRVVETALREVGGEAAVSGLSERLAKITLPASDSVAARQLDLFS